MCLGTLVMGGLRHIIIGAKDGHGGAVGLLNHSAFLKSRNIKVTWMDTVYN